MKKFLSLSLLLLLTFVALAGCGGNESATSEEQSKTDPDIVTTASTVNKEEGFIKAISEEGTWIIVTLNDLTFDKDLVVEGEFRNKDDAKNDLYRKIAPYTQDADRKVIDRFTITAPKLTIKSPNTKFQGGTFVGDIYVEANGFVLQDAKVEGNIYFANEEYKASFDMSNKGLVTGVTEVKAGIDVVTTASTVNKEEGFIKAISEEGTWIIVTLNDLTFDKDLVVEGEFRNKDDAKNDLYRKIAPYTQDADRKVIDRFTITAPKLTVKSPNTKFQGGTFVGDIYVEANGFVLQDAKVEGNIYFVNEEYKASFDMSNKGVVTGVTEVKAGIDVVTTASTVNKEEGFIKAISEEGTWIIVTLNDLTFDKDLVVEGEFRNKDDAKNDLYRKIAPYTQGADRKVIDRFTITAPKLTIKSPNTKFQGGTFVGDIYVEANGFVLQDAKVEGNIYFANEEYKASFDMSNKGVVTGVTEVKVGIDVVTTASTVNKEEGFIKAISEEGTWIIVTLNDLTFDKDLVVEGEFRNKDDAKNDLYRKIAPYTQGADRKVIDRFTITAPKLTIKSPNTKFQGGTFIGDIYVEANGFVLQDAKVEGNIYFANEEYKASFDMSNKGVVTGVTEVKAGADEVSSASETD